MIIFFKLHYLRFCIVLLHWYLPRKDYMKVLEKLEECWSTFMFELERGSSNARNFENMFEHLQALQFRVRAGEHRARAML